MRRLGFLLGAKSFDLCIIGGGPAGVAAALRAVEMGRKAVIIEKERIGGCDLWKGALQSKTLWEMAKFAGKVRGPIGQRLMKLPNISIDQERMHATLDQAARTRYDQILKQLEGAKVPIIHGAATFNAPNEVEVLTADGEYENIASDYFIIATGSKPREHPQFKIDHNIIVTSDDIMQQKLPGSMVIIGAGVIGCEFASIMAMFGATQVNIIEKAKRILPMEDEDVALYIQTLLEARGVVVHKECSLRDLCVKDGKVQYMIRENRSGENRTFTVDRALISIGRTPNFAGLGLENIQCTITDGRLKIDKFMRATPHQHIYAVGDASGDIALVNMGELQARSAVEHMFGTKPARPINADNLSTIMFLDEEVAAVGMNEQQCRKESISYIVARYGYEFVGRAICMGDTKGFVKIIVTKDNEKRVLGVRAVGPHASSVVELASLAIHNQQSAYELSELMTAYPAVTQGFQECLRMLLGRSILKEGVFPQLRKDEWDPPHFGRGRCYQEDERVRLSQR